jgi:uncharacterized repeat protein (TIGR01451 family)
MNLRKAFLLVVLAVRLAPSHAFAACPDFVAAPVLATGASPFAVSIGDFNGDGKRDLAVANANGNSLSIILGNGNGTFAAAVNYGTGTSPVAVGIGDFNGDGKSDLAVTNLVSNDVSVLLGNGNGTFGVAVQYAAGMFPRGIAVGDFNGDGKRDLAVANQFSDNVSIFLGNGNGTFAAAVSYAVGSQPYSLAIGDFNGDGGSDLAVPNGGANTFSILAGNGNGTFAAAVTYPAPFSNSPLSIVVADFNGDGKSDFALGNYNSNDVSIHLGNGSGTFATPVSYPVGGLSPYLVAAGDFNGDGRIDLALADRFSDDVAILLGNGNGTFGAPGNFPVAAASQPVSVAIGDLNGDGASDLAVADSALNNVTVLTNLSTCAAVTSLSPPSGSDAGGQSVTISGTSLSGAVSVLFGGVAAAITANTPTSITVTTPSHAAGAVDVVVHTAGGGATAAGAFTFVLAADVRITKSAANLQPLPVGSYLTYIITVLNAGPDTATNVVVTDVLPPGMSQIAPAVPDQGTCSGTTTITCALGSIANGFSAHIAVFVAMPLTPGMVSNTATVAAAEVDPDPSNNSSTSTTQTFDPGTIPALSEWGLLALAAMLALFAVARMRG